MGTFDAPLSDHEKFLEDVAREYFAKCDGNWNYRRHIKSDLMTRFCLTHRQLHEAIRAYERKYGFNMEQRRRNDPKYYCVGDGFRDDPTNSPHVRELDRVAMLFRHECLTREEALTMIRLVERSTEETSRDSD